MDLTWRDAISTLAVGAIFLLYMTFMQGGALPLLSSAWANAAAILVIGLGGMVISVRGDSHTRSKELFQVILRRAASVLGVIALIAGLAALVADSSRALTILVAFSIMVWGASVVSHV
jgi:hypothetical protein